MDFTVSGTDKLEFVCSLGCRRGSKERRAVLHSTRPRNGLHALTFGVPLEVNWMFLEGNETLGLWSRDGRTDFLRMTGDPSSRGFS